MEGRFWTLGLVLAIVSTLISLCCGCGTRYAGGWGAPAPLLVLPPPTLIPKLKAAFLDGKASVAFKGRSLGWAAPHPHPISLPHPVAVIKPHTPLNINGLGWAPNFDDFGEAGVNRAFHPVNHYHPGGNSYNSLNYDGDSFVDYHK